MFGRVLGLLFCCWLSVQLLLKLLVACSTLVWLLVVSSPFGKMFGRVLHLSLAAGRQFDFFYIIWSCVRPALFGCRSSVRFFLTCLVVCSTLVWLFLSFGLLFSCLVVYCSTLFLTLLIIRLLVVYCLFLLAGSTVMLAVHVFAPTTFLRSLYSFIWCLP